MSWCARAGRPYSIIEDPEYVNQMKTGRPAHEILNRCNVAADVQTAWTAGHKMLRQKFRVRQFPICTQAVTDLHTEAERQVQPHLRHVDQPKRTAHICHRSALRGKWAACVALS